MAIDPNLLAAPTAQGEAPSSLIDPNLLAASVEEEKTTPSLIDPNLLAASDTLDTSETDESVAQEFFEGIGSGLIAIPQGILELGAAGWIVTGKQIRIY